jgi:protein-S-isoprenylcysteine O-methyltransferase Ste14
LQQWLYHQKEKAMIIYDKKVHSWLAVGQAKGGENTYKKSAVERYRRWVVWFLYAGIFATVIFSPSQAERDHLLEYSEIVSYLLVAVATIGRLWCGIYVFGRKSKALCQDGPYSICRNPLYIFTFLGALGVATASNRIDLIVSFASIYCFYYFLVVKFEEKRLSQLFGRDYEAYCARVHRFLPNFRKYQSRERIEINPNLLSRAMVKGMWFFCLIFALEIIQVLKKNPW